MTIRPLAKVLLLFAVAATLVPLAPHPAASVGPLKVAVLGQALIDYDIRQFAPASVREFREVLRGSHVIFTNLEATIQPHPDARPADPQFGHAGPPAVLDALAAIGVNLLSLSNNHAFDLGREGVLATLEAVAARGLAATGIGRTLSQAAAPARLATPAGRVALVAVASGALPAEAAATPGGAGVHVMGMSDDLRPDTADMARLRGAIATARQGADLVMLYLHTHHWAGSRETTPPWLIQWAREMVEAGAGLVVIHGPPVLHGLELYRGAPIFYSLGNFIFHTRYPVGERPPAVWESLVVHLEFEGFRLSGVRMQPVILNEAGEPGSRFLMTRGAPRLADAVAGQRILGRFAALSQAFGTSVRIADDNLSAQVTLPR